MGDTVTIIIVNWNTGGLLHRCLLSLAALPERVLIDRVLVVDNASTDDSMKQAKAARLPLPTEFIGLPHNVGFARANNIAWRKVRQNSHILLLNPDTEVRAGAVQVMVDAFKADRVGIVGPRLVNPDGSGQLSVRQFPTLAVFVILFLKLHRIFAGLPAWQRYMQAAFDYTKPAAVDQVMGAAFLVRNTAWESIGLLDERFWIWFEEVDYCKRAKAAGWMVHYTPMATVVHHGAASFSQLFGPRKSWLFLRGALQYAHKHLGLAAWVLLWVLVPFSLALSLPAGIVHAMSRQRNQKLLYD